MGRADPEDGQAWLADRADHGAGNGNVRTGRLSSWDGWASALAAQPLRFSLPRLTSWFPSASAKRPRSRVGLALGRGDDAAIARAGWTAWIMGVAFMGAMALGCGPSRGD